MKTCIAYFSREGNSKIAAQCLADKLNAEVLCLHTGKGYNGIFGFVLGGFMAGSVRCAKLNEKVYQQINASERVILVSPVWAGKVTPFVNSVLKKAELKGKSITVITLQADPTLGGAESRAHDCEKMAVLADAVFNGCYALVGNGIKKHPMSIEKMKKQIDEKVAIN